MDKPNTMSLKEFMESTFSKEFLEEADKEYVKAQVEGLQHRMKQLEAKLKNSKEANKKLRDLSVRLFDAGASAWHDSDSQKSLLEFLDITKKEYGALLIVKDASDV